MLMLGVKISKGFSACHEFNSKGFKKNLLKLNIKLGGLRGKSRNMSNNRSICWNIFPFRFQYK